MFSFLWICLLVHKRLTAEYRQDLLQQAKRVSEHLLESQSCILKNYCSLQSRKNGTRPVDREKEIDGTNDRCVKIRKVEKHINREASIYNIQYTIYNIYNTICET